ncbi:M6 family metalloprotease domain-containing protein [Nonomuraea sp. bgisy101]|uniref:M6 family metalloprotease domain-containing protein n=1 Tax=Nonomuraea sp. bgisy101 TaxID=3413784 RepID=UPI003D733562
MLRPLVLATALAASVLAVPASAHAAAPRATETRAAETRATETRACALPGRTGWTDEGHDTDHRQFRAATGRIRAVMLFVDFPDAAAEGGTVQYADHFAPAEKWLAAASYGRARLSITPVHTWFRMPQDSTTYGFDRGISYEQHRLYVRQAVAAADAEVDFSAYDIVYIVPSRNAAAVRFSPTYLWDPAQSGVVADGAEVKWGVTFGQDMWRWGHKVLAHETGHIFGLPDLYSFTGPDYHRFVGGWDVMGLISGPSPQPFAWHARKLGWISDGQVACVPASGGTYRLTPVERPGGRKLVVVRTGDTSAYAIESRKGSECSGGMVIYKVDSAVATGEGPIRVMDAKPDAVPPAGCHALDDGAYGPGQVFTDESAKVRVEVKGDLVRVDRLGV